MLSRRVGISAARPEFRFIEQSGCRGNWWTTVIMATASIEHFDSIEVVTSPEYECILPKAVEDRVLTPLMWDTSSRFRQQLSYARDEWDIRRIVRDGVPSLLPLQVTGLVRSNNVIQFFHNPVARPSLGNQFLGSLKQELVRRSTKIHARHASVFSLSPGEIVWPHPIGPASFSGRSCELNDIFPGVADIEHLVLLLVFGRSAASDNLVRLFRWVSHVPMIDRRRMAILVASSPGSIEAPKGLLLLERDLPIDSSVLDSVLEQVDAIAVPYASHPESVSGVMMLGAAHGCQIVAGSSVDPSLAFPPPHLAAREWDGLVALRKLGMRRRINWSESLNDWGRQFAEIIRTANIKE
jgi:hypothetical protein